MLAHNQFRRHRRVTAGIALVLGLAPVTARAESLAERMPGDAILYFEWAGSDVLKAASADTPYSKLLADPGMSKLISEAGRTISIFIKKQAAEEGDAEIASAAMRVLTTLWHKPVALDVFGVSMTETGPGPEAALIIDIGRDAALFVRSLEDLAAKAGGWPPAVEDVIDGHSLKRLALPFLPVIRYGLVDGVFLLTVGEGATTRVLASMRGEGKTVARDERLQAALKRIGTKGRSTLMLFHLDVQLLVHHARKMITAMTGADTFPPVAEAVLEATSINRLRSVTGAWQVSDGGFRESWFVALPPVDGRPRWLNQAPVTDAELAMVPADATFAEVAHLRLADLYDGLMHVVSTVGPVAQIPVANGIAQIEGAMGLRIKEDILDLLDDGMVLYNSPSSGGLLFTGFVVLVETLDADGVGRLLERLVSFVGKKVSPAVVSIERRNYKGRSIHFASVTGPPVPVAPAWCVYDRYVIIGLYPQTVMRAVDHLSDGDRTAKSLLANPDFARARKFLPEGCSAIIYSDAKRGMSDMYRLFLPALTAAVSWARQQGVQINAGMIPSQAVFVGHMYGEVGGLAPGREGVLITSHGPLPFAMVGAAAPIYAAVLGVSVLLPSLARARDLSKRAVSQANVGGIMSACLTYARENEGKFPANLQVLVDEGSITEKMLHSPRDDQDRVSYIYIAGYGSDSPPSTIVIYENAEIGDREGSAVGFIDGHAEWLDAAELQRRLKEQQLAAEGIYPAER